MPTFIFYAHGYIEIDAETEIEAKAKWKTNPEGNPLVTIYNRRKNTFVCIPLVGKAQVIGE